jgi:hypothetical protein
VNKSINGKCTCAAIIAGFIKIALPMIVPATMVMQLHKPNLRSS